MTLKERVIDFFHMIREYAEFQLDPITEVDFVGDTKEEIFKGLDEWVNSNRFRRKRRQEREQQFSSGR